MQPSAAGLSTTCFAVAPSVTCRSRMPKVVYANIIWFLVVMASTIGASLARHGSPQWDKMADVRLYYDILFVGIFGCYCAVSIVGLLKRKKWGYSSAMGFNYVIAALSVIPVLGLLFFSLLNDIPLSEVSDANWGITPSGIALGLISLVFIIIMRRQNVKSVF